MKNLTITRFILLSAVGCLMLLPCVSSASGEITAYMGNTIELQGYSYGSTDVYLFLTGPNLPENGVTLQDITARADTGHFTKVNVDSNDHWVYSWHTNILAGRLDAGTYTVWVVTRPRDRSRLAEADYRTISVTLRKPSVTLDTAGIPGALTLITLPEGATVEIEGTFRGRTPLTLSSVEPGTYTITFSKAGFFPLSASARVEAGKTTEVTGTLMPFTGSLNITTIPPGALVRIDEADKGISPVMLSNLTAGNHTLTLSKEKFKTTVQQVTVVNGSVAEIRVLLQADSTAGATSLPATGSGPVLIVTAVLGGLLATLNRKTGKR